MPRPMKYEIRILLLYVAAWLAGIVVGSAATRLPPVVLGAGVPVSIIVILVILILERRRTAQDKKRLAGQLESWDEVQLGEDANGTLYGRVLLRPTDKNIDSGSILAEVWEKQDCGHWHEPSSPGPVAVVLAELATVLRQQAMKGAADS